MAKYTPMIEQYLSIKAEHPDAFLFFRLGDFYELFFEDATLASRELEITLTGRAGGGDERIPMCGVPYHSSMQYIRKLIEKGYKVAICEQVEDPKEAKGVVKREVIRVITPGTLMEEQMLQDRENNYILFFTKEENQYALAASDLSTGEFLVTQTDSLESLLDEAIPYQSAEIVLSPSFLSDEQEKIKSYTRTNVYQVQEWDREKGENPSFLCQGKQEPPFPGIVEEVIRFMLYYLQETQKRTVEHLQSPRWYEPAQYLKLDAFSRRNLELTETIRDHSKKGSLLWLLDESSTAMGSRLLKKWILRPLMNETQIEQRLDVVNVLIKHALEREEIVKELQGVYDLERLAGRVSFGNVNPRDLLQLKSSLQIIPLILDRLKQLPVSYIHQLADQVDPCEDLAERLERAINEEAPLSIKEGGIFKQGFHHELDRLLEASRNGKQWIAELEAVERKRTGIKSLKVGYNKVFGYYIEVTKANLHNLEDDRYERKQTLANAERYITPELKEKEALILEANDRLMDLEYELFLELRQKTSQYLARLQRLAEVIAQLDVLCSFAKVSEKYGYVRPSFAKGQLSIREGRHPVVEKVMGESRFVSNDVKLDQQKRKILLITGPNMAGKSTYMRQTALISIMAQIGCFVPAREAKLPLFDQIFTRIGAADDLVGGQSTFMVEMIETKRAITQATSNSLILLDEIGRGTSTYDGMSLAQAVVEHIHHHVYAFTLFSTHYHELTELENQLENLTNVHVACTERDGNVIFLHKVKEGRADRSYGIHVAKLAQMPQGVIQRAHEILTKLESDPLKQRYREQEQLSFFETPERDSYPEVREKDKQDEWQQGWSESASTADPYQNEKSNERQRDIQNPEQQEIQMEGLDEKHKILEKIQELNLVTVTPLEALNTLFALQERLRKTK